MHSLIRLPSPDRAWALPVAAPSLVGLRLWYWQWALSGPWPVAGVSWTIRLHRNPRTCRPTKRSGRAIVGGDVDDGARYASTFLISPSVTYRSQSAPSCHGPASVGQKAAGVRGGFVHCPLGASNGRVWGLMYKLTSPPRHHLQFQASRSA